MPVSKTVVARALRSATRDLDEPRRDLARRTAVTTELDARTLRAARRIAVEYDVPLSEVLRVAARLTLADEQLARRLARELRSPGSGSRATTSARKGKVTRKR